MLRVSQMSGVAVYAPKGSRDGGTYRKVGKVRSTVFSPAGDRVVGFLVHRPDVAAMVKRSDLFLALDAMAPCDGGVRATKADESFDDAARERLGLDWDRCLIWAGMDARTVSGKVLGYVGDASFNSRTGAVESFFVGDGNVAEALVGSVAIPPSMLRGYEEGFMVVDDAAAKLGLTGGAAGRAGEGYAKAKAEGKKVASKVGKRAGEAAETGSRALGKQLGKTKGMFGAFMDEYRRASK